MNKEIEMLYKTIEAKDKIINNQVLEIARLNNEIQLRIKSIEKLENDIIEYQRKITKLKDELDGNVTEAYENSEWWHNRFIGQQNANEILRNRIDKAIEYIKLNIRDIDYDTEEYDYLMNILKGEENE